MILIRRDHRKQAVVEMNRTAVGRAPDNTITNSFISIDKRINKGVELRRGFLVLARSKAEVYPEAIHRAFATKPETKRTSK